MVENSEYGQVNMKIEKLVLHTKMLNHTKIWKFKEVQMDSLKNIGTKKIVSGK